MLNSVVVKASSAYNAILGRNELHAFKAIASTCYRKIKFLVRNGVGEEKRDQKIAKSFYVASLSADRVRGNVNVRVYCYYYSALHIYVGDLKFD